MVRSLPCALALAAVPWLVACSSSDGDACASGDPDHFDACAFAEPPVEHRPWVRWWWPGGAVDAAQLDAELGALASQGFGGVEVQAFTSDLSGPDLERPGVRTWGSAGFFDAVAAADGAAAAHGLAFDVNLGSAWPAGAPTVDEAPARQLVLGSVDVVGPSIFTGPLPPPSPEMPDPLLIGRLGPFDENVVLVAVVAAQVIDGAASPPVLADFRDIRADVEGGGWSVPDATWRIFAVYANESRQLVAHAAYASDAPVVDHLDVLGAQEILREVGDPLVDAAPGARSVFIDSFELSAELPWTTDMLQRFQEAKGYDPTPWLPLLFRENGEPEQEKYLDTLSARFASQDVPEARIREDYEDVRSALFLQEHIEPLRDWAHARGVSLRLQAHGGFADTIDAYAMADIPESEGLFAKGTYDFLKLAASGGHIGGRTIIASESFVGLSGDPRGLSIDDFHLLAGRAYSAGINRLVYHGFTYHFVQSDGEPWYPWETGLGFTSRLDEAHPVWETLPELNRVFARTSYAMTRGRHAADLAWLHAPIEHRNGVASLSEGAVPRSGESATSRAILEAGYVYDRVSRHGLENARTETDGTTGRTVLRIGEATYPALLLANLDAASPELLEAVVALGDAGVPVVVLGALPTRARGWADHESRDQRVLTAVAELESNVSRVDSPTGIGAALDDAGLAPAIQPVEGGPLLLSLERRTTPGGEILLLFNESDAEVTQALRVGPNASRVRVFDPALPRPVEEASLAPEAVLELTVPARRWRILVLDR